MECGEEVAARAGGVSVLYGREPHARAVGRDALGRRQRQIRRAGPHDWLSSFRYAADGDLLKYSKFGNIAYTAYSAAEVVIATPFAFATGVSSYAAVSAVIGDRENA